MSTMMKIFPENLNATKIPWNENYLRLQAKIKIYYSMRKREVNLIHL